MSRPQTKEAIARELVKFFGLSALKDVYVTALRTTVQFRDAKELSFDDLERLAEWLDTTDINLRFDPGEPGWSEVTPGYSGYAYLDIGIGAEK